jgi:uncharacterized protein (TIGR02266 family)
MSWFRRRPEQSEQATVDASKPAVIGQVARAKRVQIATKVDLHTRTNFFVGESLNLSEGGLFVATHVAVAIGSEVELRFALPSGKAIDVRGVVRWCRSPDDRRPMIVPGIGIQFVGLSEADQEEVRQFVAIREPIREE